MCREWRRQSFQNFPDELAYYRNLKYTPTAKGGVPAAAKSAAQALIAYLKKKQNEGAVTRVKTEDITVGKWVEKFTALETSPRTGINASKNRPYSYGTLDSYRIYYDNHIKGDPICDLKMAEVEEADILEFITRLSVGKLAVHEHLL